MLSSKGSDSRIMLARASLLDADELIAAHVESTAYHAPWAAPFTDHAGFHAWFVRGLTGPNVSLVARENASLQIVGVVNLNEIVAGVFMSAYLGYHGMKRFAGQGLMTEAVGAAVRYAFVELGLHRLEANIQPGNTRSIELVSRLDFEKEGFSPKYLFIDGAWRDHERWTRRADMPAL